MPSPRRRRLKKKLRALARAPKAPVAAVAAVAAEPEPVLEEAPLVDVPVAKEEPKKAAAAAPNKKAAAPKKKAAVPKKKASAKKGD